MDLWSLRRGHKIRTRDGTEAEVLSETEDGAWIKVRYLEVTISPRATSRTQSTGIPVQA